MVVIAHDLKRKVRADRGCSEPYERSQMVRRPRLTGMDHDGRLEPEPRFVQSTDHGTEADEPGDRGMIEISPFVAQNDDARPVFDSLQDCGCEGIDGGAESHDSAGPVEEHGEYPGDDVRL